MERSSVLTGRAWGSGQQHLSGPDLTPARPHLPGEPREKWKTGKMGKIGSAQPGSISSMPCHSPCAVLERGLQPPRAFLLPLGNITAPDLEAFFGKCHQLAMSQSWLSAACPVPGVGLCPRAPPCCSLSSHLPAHTQRLCWQGQSRGLGLPRPCLASWSPGDRRTDGHTDAAAAIPGPGIPSPPGILRAARPSDSSAGEWLEKRREAGPADTDVSRCAGREAPAPKKKTKTEMPELRLMDQPRGEGCLWDSLPLLMDQPLFASRRVFMGFFYLSDGPNPLCLEEKGVYGIFYLS